MIDFIRALEGWGVSITFLIILVGTFVISQIIGTIVDACGKTAPAVFNILKWIKTNKDYKKAKEDQYKRVEEALAEVKSQQKEVKDFLENVQKHYDEDNIAKRDEWMLKVNTTMHWAKERAEVYDASVEQLHKVVEKVEKQSDDLQMNNKMTSELYKQFTRTDILNFAHRIINTSKADKPVIFSREEFRKIRKSYEAYEEFLATYGGTNGEVDDAMEVIKEAQLGKVPNIIFVEDMRD